MREIHVRRWEVVLAFLFNVLAIIVVTIILTNENNKINKVAKQNTASICAERHYYKERIKVIDSFLMKNPGEILRVSLMLERREFKALLHATRFVDCGR